MKQEYDKEKKYRLNFENNTRLHFYGSSLLKEKFIRRLA